MVNVHQKVGKEENCLLRAVGLVLGLQAVTDCCRLDASAAVDAAAHNASAPHG